MISKSQLAGFFSASMDCDGRKCDNNPAMDVISILNEPLPRAERKIEQICQNFDMDCSDLDHEACWRGDRGAMPCCGLEVEFDRVHGICPFLWLKCQA